MAFSPIMQDAKIKREARRRKILDNSEKRLQKITRLKYGEDEPIPDYLTSCSSTNDNANEPPKADDSDYSASTSHTGGALFENPAHYDDPVTPSTFSSSLSSPRVTPVVNRRSDVKIWGKLGFKLVVLAVIVRIVHIFRLGYLFGETVVIPFSLFMMTQLSSCQFDQNMAGITGPVLLFLGVSPSRIKNLLICYNVVTSILIYFGIYFFTFVLVHLICVIIFGL